MKICPVCDRTFAQGQTCPDCRATLVARVADPLIGLTLKGAYELESKIGSGGMGAVYRATQRPLGRAVAVKVLPPGPSQEGLIKRFFREAQLLSQLVHPNIVQVIDFGNTEQGLAFMVMEFLQGLPLDSIVPGGRGLPLPFAHAVMEQMCAGVGAAHGQGLVHRDLKPGNVFIARQSDGSQVVKILDFGLARAMDHGSASSRLTQAGTLMGTPGYIAPEQISNPLAADARSDIYAMGAILVFLLTGREAYTGDSVQQILAMQIARPPSLAPLRELKLPQAIDGLILTVMDPDPTRRLQNTDEFLMALRQATGLSLSRLPALSIERRPGQDSQRTKLLTDDSGEMPPLAEMGLAPRPGTAAENGTSREAMPSDPLLAAASELRPLSPSLVVNMIDAMGKRSAPDDKKPTERKADDKRLPELKPDGGPKADLSALLAAIDASPGLKPDAGPKSKARVEKAVGLTPRVPAPLETGEGLLKEDADTSPRLATDGLDDVSELNPHSSGEVPLIDDMLALRDLAVAAGDAPRAPRGVGAQAPTAHAPAEPGATIDPNAAYAPLELMPVEERAKTRSRPPTAPPAPLPPRSSLPPVVEQVLADPRRRAAAIGVGVALMLFAVWGLFGGREDPRPKEDPAKVAAESAREAALGWSRNYAKQFNGIELPDTASLEAARQQLAAAAGSLSAGQYAAAERDYRAAGEGFKAAISESQGVLATGKADCERLSVQVRKNYELCAQLYQNPELVDRSGVNQGQRALEDADRAFAKQRYMAARAAYQKAQEHLLAAIEQANSALGDLRQTAQAAQARAIERRQQFNELYADTDLDLPSAVQPARLAMSQGDAYIGELKFQQAQTAFVDAAAFFGQAVQQVKNQLDALEARYSADRKAAEDCVATCRDYLGIGRVEVPPEWDGGQRLLAQALDQVTRRQYKKAAQGFAETRSTLEVARRLLLERVKVRVDEAHRTANTAHQRAKAKYDPTDVPPPEELRQAWVQMREAERCVTDGLHVEGYNKFEQAAAVFRTVENEADGVLLAAERASQKARQDAIARREAAVKRIRGRETLPPGPDALVARGDTELGSRRLLGSLKTFQDSATGFVQALADFEERLAAKKRAAEAVRERALAAARDAEALGDDMDRGKLAEAAAVVKQGNDLFPDEKFDEARLQFGSAERLTRQGMAVAYIRRGSRQFSASAWNDALTEFERAVGQDDTNPKAYYNRGITYYQLGDIGKAIEDLDRTISLGGADADTYYSRALAHDRRANQGQALSDLDRAIELAPGDWRAYYKRGDIYMRRNQNAQALSSLRSALERAPDAATREQIQTLIQRLQGGR